MNSNRLLAITVVFIFVHNAIFLYIYASDLVRYHRDYMSSKHQLYLQNTGEYISQEIDTAKSTLLLMRALFDNNKAIINTPDGLVRWTGGVSKMLESNYSQYNGYFALEPDLARELSGKDGWVVTTHKNIEHLGTADYGKPEDSESRSSHYHFYQESAEEVWYHVAKKSEGLEITDIYFDANYMEKWLFSVGMGIYEDGKFKGMLGVDILLQPFFARIEEHNLGNGGGLFLVNRDTGRIATKFVSSNTLPFTNSERGSVNVRNFKGWDTVVNKEVEFFPVEASDGSIFRVSNFSMQNTPWILVAFEDELAGLMPLYKEVARVALALLSISCIILLVIRLFAQNLNKSIDQLAVSGEKLRRSESVFHAVFDQASNYMTIVEPNGTVEAMNLSAKNEIAIDGVDEIEGPIWSSPFWIKTEVESKNLEKAILAAASGEHVALSGLYTNLKGEVRNIEAQIFPIVGANEETIGVLISSHDVTIKKKTEQQLLKAKQSAEQASELKSQFLANMSHEIRTPLNGIIGMLYLINDRDLADEERERLEIIRSSSHSLLAIINEILDLSKIEAGKLEIALSDFDLCSLLSEVATFFGLQAEEKGLQVNLDISGIKQTFVRGDEGRLRQILNNLLSNALKFTHQGQIAVTAKLNERKNSRYEFLCTVSDTGIGIESEKIAGIMEPFTQLDSSTSREYGGTGLGLSICKELCELMSGELVIASKLGKGTTVTFKILLDSPLLSLADVLNVRATHVMNAAVSKKVILVVDDNAVNRLVAQQLIQHLGYHCEVAEGGREAVTMLASSATSNKFSAIIMDCQMPGMDGFETTRRIRAGEAGEEYCQIPIVAATASAMEGDRERCLEASMDEYVAKPIHAEQLEAIFSKVIKK